MEVCTSKISIHKSMGTTQDERLLEALSPDFFLVEERSEIDYIQFSQKIAPYLKFFNTSNAEEGNWSNFFQWESISILVQIYLWEVNKLRKDYEKVKEAVAVIPNINQQKTAILSFFETIETQLSDFNQKIPFLDDEITAKAVFLGTIENITTKIFWLKSSTNDSTNPATLISQFLFDKNVQQLFGLMMNWKQVSGDSLQIQLESYPKNSPHFALFLSFLKLLGIAQKELNTFTKRHLDFYYKEVLKIENSKAVVDYVHLYIEPSKANSSHLVPKDTVLLAGKDANDANRYYATTSDFTLNAIQLESFISTSTTEDKKWVKANLKEVNATETPFNNFTYQTEAFETGLLIASPLFFLNGGDRNLIISINDKVINTTKFRFYITGEKETIEITQYKIIKGVVCLNIPASEKKIVCYNPEIHTDIAVTTNYPVLKIVPKYAINQIDIQTIKIKIIVNGLKNFILATDTGIVDIVKPFKPFGEFPKKGNGFVLGCQEYFMKKNAELTFDIEGTFGGTTKIEKLINGKWSESKAYTNSFTNTSPLETYQEKEVLPDNSTTSGFLKITLDDNYYYGEKFLQNYIIASKAGSTLPVAPVVQSIFLNYSVSQTLTLSDTTTTDNAIELFTILPFGFQKVESPTQAFPLKSPKGGEIYLGFANAEEGNTLSVLMQLAEGTANPRQETATVSWEYLNGNTWTVFETEDLGDETNGLTQSGIVKIKIPAFDNQATTVLTANYFWIKISVNKIDAICNFIGIHPQALKAVFTDYEQKGTSFIENITKESISKLKEPLSFIKKIKQPYPSFGGKKQDDDNMLYLKSSERLRHKKRAITSWDYERLILQEFPEVYRVKCLNHYRYDSNSVSNVSAGCVTIIPIAKSNEKQSNNSWKPLLSLGTMVNIKNAILKVASPHIKVFVKTPALEKIEVKFKVKYKVALGADTRLYADLLKETINQYLSPWAYTNQEINFANETEISSLIQLIDNQSFVDYIIDFEVNQIILNQNNDLEKIKFSNVKDIVPQTDYTLFIPNDSHIIEEIKNC